jgi:hypothetical protein
MAAYLIANNATDVTKCLARELSLDVFTTFRRIYNVATDLTHFIIGFLKTKTLTNIRIHLVITNTMYKP